MTRIPAAPTPAPTPRRWELGETPWQQLPTPPGMRARVIIDNDFSGDPDDLYQLVHHLLCPTVDIRAVIGSHLREGDPFDPGPGSAEHAVAVVEDVFSRMGLRSRDRIVRGAEHALEDSSTPRRSPAVDAIITEALREDTEQPLYYAAGGGLTDLASALLIEPRIAPRLTLVWIGGNEHEGLASPPPDAMPVEYNLLIDLPAAQAVFAAAGLRIWQVPRDVYRQCLVSDAELRRRVAATGPLGAHLHAETVAVTERATAQGRGPAQTYALGDSPLVLLTALQSLFEADPSSCRSITLPTPDIAEDGSYIPRPDRRGEQLLRVLTQVDTRLMFEDMFHALAEFDAWQSPA